MSDPVTAVGQANFTQEVLEASKDRPVVVDFWAAWCGPCKALAPILENVARSLGDQVRIVKVDTDAEPELAGQFHIRSIPTVMVFRHGKLASQFVGVQPEKAIRDWLQPLLPLATEALRQQALNARTEGDLERARQLFGRALAEAPLDQASRLDLAELEFGDGQIGAARQLLRDIPDAAAAEPRVVALRAKLHFADELTAVGAGSSDLDQLYAEGLKAAVAGRYGAAADAFLALTTRSRVYREDAGRTSLLRLFEVNNAEADEVAGWRRRLGQLLH